MLPERVPTVAEILRDIRNIKQRIDCKVFDVAVGVLIPIYNRSNDVVFAAAKGDTSIHHVGIKHNSILIWSKYQGKIIFLLRLYENLQICANSLYLFVCLFYVGKQQKDVCFAQSLSHANEICQIYQLTSNSIESISYKGTVISDICLQEVGAAAEWDCANHSLLVKY